MARADSSRAASLAWVARGLSGVLGSRGWPGWSFPRRSVSTLFAAGEARCLTIVIASAVVLFRSSRAVWPVPGCSR
jgi:hypothetical protein